MENTQNLLFLMLFCSHQELLSFHTNNRDLFLSYFEMFHHKNYNLILVLLSYYHLDQIYMCLWCILKL
ncbi:hypothetical protein METHB2_60074 [Candidatus Methylobacter favarea]|uniref:Uncharacterized protein n=1 Tax=Candidatus Methylobacter favarea TaxID=2707345 RepID=A0A8S0XKN7_9GAMM|nr:hypothetical protein METHB2_60074 [Candidatus Methylobacter favarea]